MQVSGIYKITSPSGHFYIGSSICIRKRWSEHKRHLKSGCHRSPQLQRAADKYGVDALKFELIKACKADKAELLAEEQKFIDELNPAYNSAKIAGSTLGVKWSDEAKARFSAARMGISVHTDESKAKIGAATKAASEYKFTDEVRKRMSDSAKARANSQEGRAHLKSVNLGRKHTAETKASMSERRKGEGSNSAVLKDCDVIEIRRIAAKAEISREKYGLRGKLATRFGVSVHNISAILAGKTWKHLLDES